MSVGAEAEECFSVLEMWRDVLGAYVRGRSEKWVPLRDAIETH